MADEFLHRPKFLRIKCCNLHPAKKFSITSLSIRHPFLDMLSKSIPIPPLTQEKSFLGCTEKGKKVLLCLRCDDGTCACLEQVRRASPVADKHTSRHKQPNKTFQTNPKIKERKIERSAEPPADPLGRSPRFSVPIPFLLLFLISITCCKLNCFLPSPFFVLRFLSVSILSEKRPCCKRGKISLKKLSTRSGAFFFTLTQYFSVG